MFSGTNGCFWDFGTKIAIISYDSLKKLNAIIRII